MAKKLPTWPKKLATWMNACGYAWSMGLADWVFDQEGYNVPVAFWCEAFRQSNDEAIATDMLAEWLASDGIDPKLHRQH